MKVVFEGIDGVGKTSVISALSNYFKQRGIEHNVVSETSNSPIHAILKEMLDKDPFFQRKEGFDTSIFESLLLCADYQYRQRLIGCNKDSVNIFDRDFPTKLVFQKRILMNNHGERIEPFFEAWKKCLLFDSIPTDLLVYIEVPIEESIARVRNRSRRENEQFSGEQAEFLKILKSDFENDFLPKLTDVNILKIDGTLLPDANAEKIGEKILELRSI